MTYSSQRSSIPISALLLAVAVSGGIYGCSRGEVRPPGIGRVSPTYNTATGRLEKLAYDRNADGRDDAWAFMDGTRLLRAELDEDFDGRVDRREVYEAAASGARTGGTAAVPGSGILTRVEIVSARTGRVVRVETYSAGILSAAEDDVDDDGRPDKWEQYRDGALATVTLDTKGRGVADRRVVYARDGGAPRIEADRDGTGQFRPVSADEPAVERSANGHTR